MTIWQKAKIISGSDGDKQYIGAVLWVRSTTGMSTSGSGVNTVTREEVQFSNVLLYQTNLLERDGSPIHIRAETIELLPKKYQDISCVSFQAWAETALLELELLKDQSQKRERKDHENISTK